MKNILLILVSLILGGLLVFFFNPGRSSTQYFLEDQSKYDFDETVAQFEAIVAETEGWKILHTYDLQKSMEKNGYKVLQVKVFSLCNPDYSSKILFSRHERVVSSMMPCRVSIYVKQDGKTYISRMNSYDMSVEMGGLVEDVMLDAFNDVEVIISELIPQK